MMKISRHVCIVLVLAFILVPFSASAVLADDLIIYTDDTNTISPTLPNAVNTAENKYGYLNINSIDFVLSGTGAEITVNYDIDSWIEFLVYLFGKQNLKERVVGVLNYPEEGKIQTLTFKYIDSKKAILTISNLVMDNGDGSYWFYKHDFGTTIPSVVMHTSSTDVKTYNNIKSMDKGFGYFQ